MANISIITDSALKEEAQSVFAELGIDMSTAVNTFFRYVVNKKSIPFEIDTVETATIKRPRSEFFGILKGKVWMADDFDAPLEEFKEYME